MKERLFAFWFMSYKVESYILVFLKSHAYSFILKYTFVTYKGIQTVNFLIISIFYSIARVPLEANK